MLQERTSSRRSRVDSLDRWQAALRRAIEHNLEVFIVADTGERMVTSASKLDTLHRTDGRTCTCEAAIAGDPVCQHRAVVRFVLGWLPAPEPQLRPCRQCKGRGQVFSEYWMETRLCPDCGGGGHEIAPQPQSLPVRLPVAA